MLFNYLRPSQKITSFLLKLNSNILVKAKVFLYFLSYLLLITYQKDHLSHPLIIFY